MPVLGEVHGTFAAVKLWAEVGEVESQALTQLKNIASMPYVFSHVAAMPDVHLGKGATVGSVIAMRDAVAPAAVGVDIGCGMMACKTNLTASDLPDSLKMIRTQIERDIPVGNGPGGNHDLDRNIGGVMHTFGQLHPKVQDLQNRATMQLGTLGGGNHFIELCLDTEDNVWMMLHSGSRNIGKMLAEIHINIAKAMPQNVDLPDRDLAVFMAGTDELTAYWRDLNWAQNYARANRDEMMRLYIGALGRFFPQLAIQQTVNCHHNYLSREIHYGTEVYVTRKGAISADVGQMGIIPGSMGTKSYIVKGLGNPESFHSASHGAGRRMSRSAAKRQYTVADLERYTEGVECRKDQGVVDEIPKAYKDIDKVMANQSDLVETVAVLKQVLCVKG